MADKNIADVCVYLHFRRKDIFQTNREKQIQSQSYTDTKLEGHCLGSVFFLKVDKQAKSDHQMQ